ncbi:MAG: type II toxin-antitoxin system Phd/YefM family antitoxin [Gemmataceae bacterium]|nr:type II toxin-antitoxin system Phd/YefM family antitoxin [Gemmataceae bacterium]
MGTTITLQETQANLPELVGKLAHGEEILITNNRQPVAKLVGERQEHRAPRVAGSCEGMITILVEDEEHLKDFAEYMP